MWHVRLDALVILSLHPCDACSPPSSWRTSTTSNALPFPRYSELPRPGECSSRSSTTVPGTSGTRRTRQGWPARDHASSPEVLKPMGIDEGRSARSRCSSSIRCGSFRASRARAASSAPGVVAARRGCLTGGAFECIAAGRYSRFEWRLPQLEPSYWVVDIQDHDYVSVHRATCRFCKAGRGLHKRRAAESAESCSRSVESDSRLGPRPRAEPASATGSRALRTGNGCSQR